MGVTRFYKRFKHNGVTRSQHGHRLQRPGPGRAGARGLLQPVQRSGGAAQPGDFDWKAIFAGGVRWFHSGGIFAALSETTGETIIDGMKAAKAAGAVISFELNYRAKLWSLWGGAEKAQSIVRAHRRERRRAGRQRGGPEIGARDPRARGGAGLEARPEHVLRMIDRVTKKFRASRSWPRRCAEVRSTNRTSGEAWPGSTGRPSSRPTCEVDVYDRWWRRRRVRRGLLLRPAHRRARGRGTEARLGRTGALVATCPGDTTMSTLEQVRAFAKGGSARIQR